MQNNPSAEMLELSEAELKHNKKDPKNVKMTLLSLSTGVMDSNLDPTQVLFWKVRTCEAITVLLLQTGTWSCDK